LAIAPWPLRYLYLLPGLETVPPMRFVGPACLFAAALGAMGVDRLADLSHRLYRVLLIAALTTAGLCTLGALLCSGQDPPIYERLDVVGEIAAKYEPVNPGLIDRDYVRDVYLRGPGDLDYLEEGRRQLRANLWRCAAAMALAALWIGILPLARRRRLLHILTLIAVLATASELVVFGARLNRGMPLPYSHETEVHDFLRQQRDRERDSGGFMVARAHTVPVEPTMLPPGTLGPERIRDLHAYTFVDGRSAEPLKALYQPTWPDFMLGYVPRTLPDTEQLRLPLFDLLGVRYLLSIVPLVHGGNRVGPEVLGPGGEFFIYERPTALPRAFMVANLKILPDDEAVIEALIAPDLDPRSAALVTPDQAELLGPWRPDDPVGERQIRFLTDRPGEVELHIGPGPGGYLVLADTSLPGWTVEVDGTPAPLARGDLFLRVVPIQVENACRVRFTYTTPGLPGGLTITVISVGLLIGLVLYLAVSRRPSPSVEKPI
jgi:hypothetical protein